jgi:hypothetical protein
VPFAIALLFTRAFWVCLLIGAPAVFAFMLSVMERAAST